MLLTIYGYVYFWTNFDVTLKKLHYKIEVIGKVQGVWFRKYTKEKAEILGLKGFVKNEINNNVYIEAEGSEKSLSEFVDWLYDGSPLSRVGKVLQKTDSIQNFRTFEIRR